MPTVIANFGSSNKWMSTSEAAYVAGVLDGEGCLTIGRAATKETRTGYVYGAIMMISNTHLPALKAIAEICGNGRIKQQLRKNDAHKPVYRLDFTANQIRHVLPQLRQHLLIKPAQADILLSFLSERVSGVPMTIGAWQAQENWRTKITHLNRRGADAPEPVPESLVARPSEANGRVPSQPLCSVDGCREKHYAKGECFQHYYTSTVRPKRMARKAERHQARVRPCQECGVTFTARRLDTAFCSRKCRDHRYYVEHADKIKAQVAAYKQRGATVQ